MNEVSTFRLYLLRSLYLLVVVGLGITLWPGIISPAREWGLAQGSVICMLAAFSILCAFGLRYPLQMLPVLLWEAIWKTMWLFMVPLPAWRAGTMNADMAEQAFGVGFVILVYAAVPWGYVYRHYIRKPAEGLRGAAGGPRAAMPASPAAPH